MPARSAKGGGGVPEIVDPAQWLDTGRDLRGLPLAVPEVVPVEVAAPLRGEHKCAPPTRSLLLERIECNRLQRHRSAARLCLRAFQPTLRERAVDVYDPGLQVNVAPFEREPFGRTKPRGSREDHHRPIAGREICCDGIEFGPRLERPLLPAPW